MPAEVDVIARLLKVAFFILVLILIAGVSGYITLSFMIKSEDRVVVPDLVSKEAVSIFEMLAQLGLNAKVKSSEYNDHIPINHIISQDPAPGSEIKKGRDVRLILSKGPKTVMIPNLKGLPLRQAQIILEENGLCSGNLSRAYSSRFIKDQVIAHSPGSGQTLEQGKCVDMLICQGVLPRTYMMPDLNGMLFGEAVLILEKMNLYPGEVIFSRREDRKENTIIGQNPLPGYRITEGSPVKLVRNRDPGLGGGSTAS